MFLVYYKQAMDIIVEEYQSSIPSYVTAAVNLQSFCQTCIDEDSDKLTKRFQIIEVFPPSFIFLL